jgi:hypothetical protein
MKKGKTKHRNEWSDLSSAAVHGHVYGDEVVVVGAPKEIRWLDQLLQERHHVRHRRLPARTRDAADLGRRALHARTAPATQKTKAPRTTRPKDKQGGPNVAAWAWLVASFLSRGAIAD